MDDVLEASIRFFANEFENSSSKAA